MEVAVIGNTFRNIGLMCAADLALCGHAVRFAVFPDEADLVSQFLDKGGIAVGGNTDKTISGRTGIAPLRSIGSDPVLALAGANVVILDIPLSRLKERVLDLLPNLENGAVIHVQSYGSWVACALSSLFSAQGRRDIIVTEARAPTTAALIEEGHLIPTVLRRGLELATIPAKESELALARMKTLFPGFSAAGSVLETGLGNINLMVHPAMSLLGISFFEQQELKGEKIRFYADANVPSAGVLGDALDAERAGVCAAYGVPYKSLAETLHATYGASGSGAYRVVLDCKPYQRATGMPAGIWREWMFEDIPYGVAPLVQLGEQANVPVKNHRAVAELFGTILGFDPWQGPSLPDLGLQGTPDEIALRFNQSAHSQ